MKSNTGSLTSLAGSEALCSEYDQELEELEEEQEAVMMEGLRRAEEEQVAYLAEQALKRGQSAGNNTQV